MNLFDISSGIEPAKEVGVGIEAEAMMGLSLKLGCPKLEARFSSGKGQGKVRGKGIWT